MNNEASLRAWEANADFWDERMGDGNVWHLVLIWPDTERLLAPEPGMRVLDVACGNGLTCRRLAAQGVSVVGVDASARMLERARARATPHDDRIEYRRVDCTDEAALRALGAFDGAVANMALMDMAEIAPLFRALAHVLKPGAPFVFSVPHPAFNGAHTVSVIETHEVEDGVETRRWVKVRGYLDGDVTSGQAIRGQPVPQPYFHRPLHALLAPAFAAGLVLDDLAEPSFPPGHAVGPLGWAAMPDMPPVLVARLRRLAG